MLGMMRAMRAMRVRLAQESLPAGGDVDGRLLLFSVAFVVRQRRFPAPAWEPGATREAFQGRRRHSVAFSTCRRCRWSASSCARAPATPPAPRETPMLPPQIPLHYYAYAGVPVSGSNVVFQ